MATENAMGHRIITSNKRWEDFKSLKQYYQGRRVNQIDCASAQVSTATAAIIDGSTQTITGIGPAAADVVYISTAVDDAGQQGKSLWVVYQDDTGLIHDAVLSKFDSADSSTEIVLGANGTGQTDTVAAVAGKVLTMTATVATLNQYAGWYTVGISGDGDQIGVKNLIVSNTAHGTAPEITLTDTPNADTAADVISIQQYGYDDFYRVREAYCEVEVNDTDLIRLGDIDSTNVYASIGEGHRYSANMNFFTQPSATCASYLGRIKASFPYDFTATKNGGASLIVYYTPKEAHSNGGAVETEIAIPFANEVVWEPCIELAPATDVVIKIKKINDALHDEVFVEASYLEVYPANSTPSS